MPPMPLDPRQVSAEVWNSVLNPWMPVSPLARQLLYKEAA
jgi:hypothetical protein